MYGVSRYGGASLGGYNSPGYGPWYGGGDLGRLGNRSMYNVNGQYNGMEGIRDVLRSVGGVIKRVAGAGAKAAAPAVQRAVAQEIHAQAPGFSDEMVRTTAEEEFKNYLPYIAAGAVVLLLVSRR